MASVAVCGAGYVGLVTAACLASLGNRIIAYDTDVTKIHRLRDGAVPFYEPGLERLVRLQQAGGSLTFTTDPRDLADAEIIFIAVSTPTGPLGNADLTYVRQAVREIAEFASGDVVVVNKSTVPVETTDLVRRTLQRSARPNAVFHVASNPEFLREGNAVYDFLHPSRIVIGTDSPRAAALLRKLYAALDAVIIECGPRTAEMIKYAANAFLATKISFVNELAALCEAVGAEIDTVLAGIAADSRIGRSYMEPGIGFGGSCLPKDVLALVQTGRSHAMEPALLSSVIDVNRRQIATFVRRIVALKDGDADGLRICIFGLAFKPDTDDVRESPALALVRALLAEGCDIRVHDPLAMNNARHALNDSVYYARDPYDAALGCSVAVLATAWEEYCKLDWGAISKGMNDPHLFDGRNALDEQDVLSAGIHYHGVGRQTEASPTKV